jgi:hypothetical protein
VVTVALLNGVVARCGREWWPSRCDATQRGGGLASVTGGDARPAAARSWRAWAGDVAAPHGWREIWGGEATDTRAPAIVPGFKSTKLFKTN